MGDFRKLEVWRKTQKLVCTVYKVTGALPAAERYGLSSQMRRAAVAELECEIILASDLRFVEPQLAAGLVTEIHSIRGMLQGLHRSLCSKPTSRAHLDARP